MAADIVINRVVASAVHKEVDEAMMEIAQKWNLVWVGARFSFSATEIKSKLRFKEKGTLKAEIKALGFEQGQEYRGHDGKSYTVQGLSKGKLLTERGGQAYKCDPGFLRSASGPRRVL